MGVIEIFGGMGRTSKVYRYPFYKLKSYPIIHFYIKEKKSVSTQKILKSCRNITVLAIPERLEFNNFSCRPTLVVHNTFQSLVPPPL